MSHFTTVEISGPAEVRNQAQATAGQKPIMGVLRLFTKTKTHATIVLRMRRFFSEVPGLTHCSFEAKAFYYCASSNN